MTDWKAIRADYENGVSFRHLAAKYNVSKTYIIEKRNKEHWNRPAPTEHRPPPSNPNGNTHDINALFKVDTAIKIYMEEHPNWDEIAARAGYSSRGAAHNAVKRELDRRVTQDVKELRTQEQYMINQIQARSYKEAMDEKNTNWTWATDRFVALSKRKSELMGMDVKADEVAVNTNYKKTIVLDLGNGETKE